VHSEQLPAKKEQIITNSSSPERKFINKSCFFSSRHITFTIFTRLRDNAEFAQSKADFINKLSIALKEANETEYWFELLFASECLDDDTYRSSVLLLKELIKMLIASINTVKKNAGK
jgi:hypothetical protein